MTTAPRYSFVATSRNDDHGGDILRRTQSWISRLAEQAERHQLPCELVLVDWNPPRTRPPLREVLAWPRGSEWFSANVLTVPPRLHLECRTSSRLSMFQMIAKNVGIKRARGEYIIATNVDIIFSDALFEWLKAGDHPPGRLYRSDRWDIPNEIQLEPDIDVLLRRAHQETIRKNFKDGTHIRRDGRFVNSTQPQFDFSFYNPLTTKLNDILLHVNQDAADLGWVREKLAKLNEELPTWRDNFFIPALHTNGCGDFTMLSREDWFALRGYPEWQIFSWAIDSVIVFQAHFNGMEVHELAPDLIHFHIEHDYGSGWTPEGSSNLWARLDQRGIPYISYDQFTDIVKELQRNAAEGLFTVYNDMNWGFAGREVESRGLVQDGAPSRPPQRVNNGPLDEESVPLKVLMIPPLESAFCHGAPLARAELRHPVDGVAEFVVETHPDQWSYSLAFDITDFPAEISECWLSVEAQVESGLVYAGLLNRDQTDFLVQIPCHEGTDGFRETRFFLKDAKKISQLVFRNGAPGGQPARFRVRAFRVLGEADVLIPVRLGELKPTSADVIVRYLRDDGDDGDGAARDEQALVILPIGCEGPVVHLDLQVASARASRLSIELHIIEGEVGFAILSAAGGEIVAEHRAAPGLPLTSVDLDLQTGVSAGSLVIRNLSATSPAKLLVHRVVYQAAL